MRHGLPLEEFARSSRVGRLKPNPAAAFKHGHYTAEAIASRREVAKLLRDARALVKQVS
jgi:hypothetical protein